MAGQAKITGSKVTVSKHGHYALSSCFHNLGHWTFSGTCCLGDGITPFFCFPLKLSRICISYLAATMSKTELWCSFLSVGSNFDEQTSNFNMNHKAPTIAVTSGLLLLSLPGTVPGELQLLLCSIGNDSKSMVMHSMVVNCSRKYLICYAYLKRNLKTFKFL